MELSPNTAQHPALPCPPDTQGLMPPAEMSEEQESRSLATRFMDSMRYRAGTAREHAGNTLAAVGEDYRTSEHRMGLLASGLGMTAVQIADRARLSVVLVPHVAISLLENNYSPLQAGVASGATFAAWCAGVGGATTEGLRQFPQTMEAVKDNYPGLVEVFNTALPGVDNYEKTDGPEKPLARRIGSRVLTGFKRGWTVSGIGTAAYVSTASVNGHSRKATHRLNANASAEGGAVVGGVVALIGEGISYISEDHPLLAQDIVNTASDLRVWYGIAGGIMAWQIISNKINKFRHRNDHEQDLPLVDQEQTDSSPVTE